MSFSNVEKEFLKGVLAGYEDNNIAINILKKLDEKKCNKKANEVIKDRVLENLKKGLSNIHIFNEKFSYRNINKHSGVSYESIKKLLPHLKTYDTNLAKRQYIAKELKLSILG